MAFIASKLETNSDLIREFDYFVSDLKILLTFCQFNFLSFACPEAVNARCSVKKLS